MFKVELIFNQVIEEEVLFVLKELGLCFYTKFFPIYGFGRQGGRQGDVVWPELNVVLHVYCEKSYLELIQDKLSSLKKTFPKEGLKVYYMSVNKLI